MRLWPIVGPNLNESLRDFLVGPLGLDATLADESLSYEVPPVRARKPKLDNEVIVLFPDIDMRDMVRSSASNLAGKKGMGIRLEIPEKLRPSLRALESVSYLIKKSNPTLKRNVKFDDETLDLVMDIKLNEDAPWQKIRPDQAKAAKKSQPRTGGDEEIDASSLQGLMGSSSS